MIELERHIEQTRRAGRIEEVRFARQAGELSDFGRKLFAGERIDFDDGRLIGNQVRAIGFVDLGANLHASGFDHVGHRPPRPDLIAGAILGQNHPPENHPA